MVFYRRFYQRCKIPIGALIAASLAGDIPVETRSARLARLPQRNCTAAAATQTVKRCRIFT